MQKVMFEHFGSRAVVFFGIFLVLFSFNRTPGTTEKSFCVNKKVYHSYKCDIGPERKGTKSRSDKRRNAT